MPSMREFFTTGFPGISLEALENGVKQKEIEFTMFVELTDLNQLKQRAIRSEVHEQWLVPLQKDATKTDGKMRIRLVDNMKPLLTTKIKREQEIGCEETEQLISMDMFKALKAMSIEGYVKTRYIIPSNIEGLFWEVDVFYNNQGSQHPWVKVDLEVKDLNDPIPKFPLDFSKVIYLDGEMTYTDKLKVDSLWKQEYQRMDT